MLKTQSGKRQRAQLKAARATARSSAAGAKGSVMDVVEEPAHDFRLKGAVGAGSLLDTVFHVREAAYEVEKRIVAARQPLQRDLSSASALASESFYAEAIPIPTKPQWSVKHKPDEVARLEDEAFEAYLSDIYARYPPTRLNHFEHNVHVWKQLWKVVDIADILVLVADARHPLFHVPPSLYDYIVNQQKKPMICVLNKIDFISAANLQAWLDDFKQRFPLLTVVPFSSFPHDWHNATNPDADVKQEKKRKAVQHERNRVGGKREAPPPYGVDNLLRVLDSVWERKVEREKKLAEELAAEEAKARLDPNWSASRLRRRKAAFAKSREALEERALEVVKNVDIMQQIKELELDTSLAVKPVAAAEGQEQKQGEEKLYSDSPDVGATPSSAVPAVPAAPLQPDDSTSDSASAASSTSPSASSSAAAAAPTVKLTVGTIGHPNAGKSSLINALFGRPVVSVSETPGKTKHLQTLTLNSRIELCDCPGLVFPAVDMPRALQALCGIFPISQLREPYTAVAYLASRIEIEKIYGLQPPVTASAAQASSSGAKKGGARKKGAKDDDEEEDMFAALQRVEAEQKAAEYQWSAWDLCEAYAKQRNYSIKGSHGLYDTQRAANDILYDTLSGVVLLTFAPPRRSTQGAQPSAATPPEQAAAAPDAAASSQN